MALDPPLLLRQPGSLRNSLDGAFLDSRGLSVVRADELQKTFMSEGNEKAREYRGEILRA
jgi:hypothetical protein